VSDNEGTLVPVPEPSAAPELPDGVRPSRNYLDAIKIGHVLAQSRYFADAREASQCAVKVMLALDLGLSPTAGLTSIHAFDAEGRTVFLIEGKALAALVKARKGYDYKIIERTETKVEVAFERDGETIDPNIVWTMDDAKRAGLDQKPAYKKWPREMLTWRCLSEGVRLHFPEILAGNAVYTDAEFGPEDADYRGALEGPKRAEPLTDEKAEALRARINAAYAELVEVNPKRMKRPLLERRIRDAEHSHTNLENVSLSIEALRDSETRNAQLLDELKDRIDPDAHRDLVERGERLTSNAERTELYERTLAESAEPVEPEPAE
jgi:hypothetical protein